MEIRTLRIQAYRSLYDVEMKPRPFRVVVGANNAGKTNLLDAIHFLGEVHRHGIGIAVSRKGGFENIAHRHQRRTKRPIAFEVRTQFAPGELGTYRISARSARQPASRRVQAPRPIELYHYFALAADSQAIDADFHIKDERIELSVSTNRGPQLLARISRAREEMTYEITEAGQAAEHRDVISPLNDEGFWEFTQRVLKPTTLALSAMAYNEVFQRFIQELSQTRFYQLAPIECRRPGVPVPSPELELHGGNLPAVVDYLQKSHKAAWNEVIAAMRAVVPKLTDVRTEYTTDRRLAIQFREEDISRPWSSEDISDGTIQTLALFCVLFDPRSRLTLVEEPENSVHPWIIRNFVDACRRVENKQVLVSTHSPVLIDHLLPEEVDIAWREEGRTLIAPMLELDPQASHLWKSGRNTIFELLDGGAIAHAIPGEPI